MDSTAISLESTLRNTAIVLDLFDADFVISDLDQSAYHIAIESATQFPRAFIVPQLASTFLQDQTSLLESIPAPKAVLTKEDWEANRSIITSLYIDEDHTLKDIMQIMQSQHSFNATTKMYKSRLTTWNVRKYMTLAERESACRVIKSKQRKGEACGKVIVRDQEKNLDVFLRHMKQSRAGMRQRRLSPNDGPREGVDTVIESMEPRTLDSSIQPNMFPGGPERSLEIVYKETSAMVQTSPEENLLSYALAL